MNIIPNIYKKIKIKKLYNKFFFPLGLGVSMDTPKLNVDPPVLPWLRLSGITVKSIVEMKMKLHDS